MSGELNLIINYMNENIRFGTTIKQSTINKFILNLNYNIEDIFAAYIEIDGLQLSVERDVSSKLGEYFLEQGENWANNIRKLIKGLPLTFSLEDIYLFSRDLSDAHIENRNVRAKIRQVLQELRDKGEILFIEEGKYKKIINEIPENQIEEDFDDLDELLNSDEFVKEMASFKDIPRFENNIEYLNDYQNNDSDVALENLYIANQKLVLKIASKYKRLATSSFDNDDMIIEGNFGLKKAIEKFDISLGYQFSTYAKYWIEQSIARAITDQSTTIRLPVHMAEKINKLTKIENKLFFELGRYPSNVEISKEMGENLEGIEKYKNIRSFYGVKPVSLDLPIDPGEGTSTLGELLPDDTMENQFELISNMELTDKIDSILSELNERDAEVIRLRFGFTDGKVYTLEEIGKKFGVSRERIRQIESKSLKKLKHPSRLEKIRDWENYK